MEMVFITLRHEHSQKQSLYRLISGPEDSRRSRLSDFVTFGTKKVVKLFALLTGRIYRPENVLGSHFF
jgi:hypothetical protein